MEIPHTVTVWVMKGDTLEFNRTFEVQGEGVTRFRDAISAPTGLEQYRIVVQFNNTTRATKLEHSGFETLLVTITENETVDVVVADAA